MRNFSLNNQCAVVEELACFQYSLKAGFHMIADRRSQIAIRSAIVCDHMETYFCDPAIMIADDRRR